MLHVVFVVAVAACPKIKLHPLRGFRHRQVCVQKGLVDAAAAAAVSAVR